MGRCLQTADVGRRRTVVTACDGGTEWRSASRPPLPDASTGRYQLRPPPRRGGGEGVPRSRRRAPPDQVPAAAARCMAAESTVAGSRRRRCREHRRSAKFGELPNHHRRPSTIPYRRVESRPAPPAHRMTRR